MVDLAAIVNNPNFIQGLAVLSGNDPREAMLRHAQGQTYNAQQQEAQRKAQVSQAMPKAMQAIQNMPPEKAFEFLMQVGIAAPEAIKLVKDMQELKGTGGASPSSVQEYKYWQSLNEKEQSDYLRVKRATQNLNLGDRFAGVDPRTGKIADEYKINLKPGELAQTKEDQAAATKRGTELGEKQALYKSMKSKMPQLEAMTQKLSALGKIATYTLTGKARDSIVRQSGLKVSNAGVARTKYLTTIDNEILPLLRDTFGTQFTENEGKSLKATLGDPDLSPEEKDAALSTFIETKMRTLGSLERELGIDKNTPTPNDESKARSRLEELRARANR